MSANRKRIERSIRDLALTPEERRRLLGESSSKGGKASSAGVGTSEAEESRLCCDGSTSSNANPGTGERDPSSGGQDGLDASDPAKLSSGDGTLSGVTDCATGEPVCFDGAGFVPPEGWDDPNEPPVDPEWVPDDQEFWYYGGSPDFDTRTKGQLKAWVEGGMDQGRILCNVEIDSDTRYRARLANVSCINANVLVDVPVTVCGSASNIGLQDLYCGTDYKNPTPEEKTVGAWPSDGCTNLAIIGGKIVGSKYDPENDGSYSAPRDSIDLCDPDNGARITLRPSGQSNYKTIDAINGGDGYLYSGGKQIARVSGDEFTDPNV